MLTVAQSRLMQLGLDSLCHQPRGGIGSRAECAQVPGAVQYPANRPVLRVGSAGSDSSSATRKRSQRQNSEWLHSQDEARSRAPERGSAAAHRRATARGSQAGARKLQRLIARDGIPCTVTNADMLSQQMSSSPQARCGGYKATEQLLSACILAQVRCASDAPYTPRAP